MSFTSWNMHQHHHMLSSMVLLCFLILTSSVNIHPVNSINSEQLAASYGSHKSHNSMGSATSPVSLDSETNVEYKDVLILPEENVSARLYLPKGTAENRKLPLLIYIHGGGFISPFDNPFSAKYHNFVSTLVSEANAVSVSVDYRLAIPIIHNCFLPCPYEDVWGAIKWIASHVDENGPDVWLNQHADFQRVFISGDSAGANIAHQISLKFSLQEEEIEGLKLQGVALAHPYFWGVDLLPGETNQSAAITGFKIACPGCSLDNPWINPAKDANLSKVATPRLQVFVSEKDELLLRERGWYYAQNLRQSGWSGYLEVNDFQAEGHVFHINNITERNSTIVREKMVTFINEDWGVSSLQMKPSQKTAYELISMVGRKDLF